MTDASDSNDRVLRASRLFASLDAQLISGFARTASRTRCARGEYLWHAADRASHFIVIASGLVKISRTAADGNETILALFGPRESVGDVAVLGARPYPADAIALTDVEALRIEAESVKGSFAANPMLLASMNAALIEHAQALQQKILIMSAGKIEKRLATLLLHLASRFGDEHEDGTTFIPLRLTRAECARLIGATNETTIRTFTRWQRNGLVETTADGFSLHDVDALTEITRS